MDSALLTRRLFAGMVDLTVLLLMWIVASLPNYIGHCTSYNPWPYIPGILNCICFFKNVSFGSFVARARPKKKSISVAWVVGFLFFLFLPPLKVCDGPPRISIVKRHMHQLKIQLEAYAREHGGTYPPQLPPLQKKSFFGLFVTEGLPTDNPFNPDLPAYGIWQGSRKPGVVYYAPVQTPQGLTRYYIYGTDKTGQPIFDKGVELFLTNQ